MPPSKILPNTDKPPIIVKSSPNFTAGRDGLKVAGIVNHIAEGKKEAVASWFNNGDADASSHYLVNQDGTIWQFVAPENTAWANGIWQEPDLSVTWVKDLFTKNLNPNKATISIEHEGKSGQPLTEKQYQATLALHKWLCFTYDLAPGRERIIGHYQIQRKERANCPGKAFPFDRLIKDLQNWASSGGGNTGNGVIDVSGFKLRGEFRQYYEQHGVVVTGLPLTDEFFAPSGRITQVFERCVLEFFPENKAPWRVQGQHLGRAWLEINGRVIKPGQ